MTGDNIYETFPNLYAVRGTPPRNCEDWYQSLDKVRRLKPHHLVPSHTEPISGKKKVSSIIKHYRDAIQFINDQTIRHLNSGYSVDEITKIVRLPTVLSSHPYLQEHYGMTVWSVRSVIEGKTGWFDRDAVNLFPLTKQEEAEKLANLLDKNWNNCETGIEKMLDVAEEFANNPDASDDEIQWSLKLAMHGFRLTEPETPNHVRAASIASICYDKKAAAAWNPAARHVNILGKKLLKYPNLTTLGLSERRVAWMKKWPISFSMEKLKFYFKAEKCDEFESMKIIFVFPDVKQQHIYRMRHCILEYQSAPELAPKKYDVRVTCSSTIWSEVLANSKDLESVYKSGDLVVEGAPDAFDQLEHFMDLLDVGKNIHKPL